MSRSNVSAARAQASGPGSPPTGAPRFGGVASSTSASANIIGRPCPPPSLGTRTPALTQVLTVSGCRPNRAAASLRVSSGESGCFVVSILRIKTRKYFRARPPR
jgi:hypothetical protein